jgi:hypothetical protein
MSEIICKICEDKTADLTLHYKPAAYSYKIEMDACYECLPEYIKSVLSESPLMKITIKNLEE